MKDLTPTNEITHVINLTDQTPVKQNCRPIPQAKKKVVNEMLTEMLENNLLEPSNSPWRSPMHVVNKKDGGTRITIDYRPLNNKTIQDALTVPYVRDLFAQLQDSKWFGKLDICSGYFQVIFKKYTAFSTDWFISIQSHANGINKFSSNISKICTTCFRRLLNRLC